MLPPFSCPHSASRTADSLKSLRLLLVAFALALGCAGDALAKPNIIFILADDLGIDGVSCYHADKRKTPNIDQLAASGTRFTTCYAAPLCGPSRCLLMTSSSCLKM